MTGETLSHYKILEELGRGGMGIVYKAEDTKLNRTVALKLLPAAALGNEDDRARFFREAQAAAQLHHSNIATVFAIEQTASQSGEDQPFIAMEYIDGDTLTKRIARGPLKLDEVVEIASQVASALEAAHEKNIVHRDVKSGNVMLTSKGVAKVLDFGLAKTAQSTKLTQLGSTLGTIAYMSPEQARGEEVDRRSDIWSLGVLLYEMISGRLPFASEYEQAAVYSILNEDPEALTAIRTGVPMGLEWIVSKCLAKKSDERYQSITDLLVDLKTVDLTSSTLSRTSSQAVTAASLTATLEPASRINTKSIAVLITVAALASLLTFLLTGRSPTTEQIQSWTIPIELHAANELWSDSWIFTGVDISSDGTGLVYSALNENGNFLYVRSLHETKGVRLEGTNGATQPKFSDDGRYVAFIRNSALYRVPVAGGFPELILASGAIAGSPGYSWTPSDDIIYVPEWGEGIWKVSSSGGESVELFAPDIESGEGGFSHPIMLPDEKTIITVRWGTGYNYEIVAIDVDSGVRSPILSGGIKPRYIEPGYLLYAQGDRLLAASFDASSMRLGNPVPVVDDGLLTRYDWQDARFTVSTSGTLVYQMGYSNWDTEFIDRRFNGSTRSLLSEEGALSAFSLSPDGKKIAYGMFTPRRDSDIFIYFLETGERRQMSNSRGYEGYPVWHPNSEYIYYSYQPGGPYQVHGRSISIGASPDTLHLTPGIVMANSVHSDGRVVLENSSASSVSRIEIADPSYNPATIEVIAETDEIEEEGIISPDGRFVAYELGGAGNKRVYVNTVASGGGRSLVSKASGRLPKWSASGRFLYYVQSGNLVKREHLGNLQFGSEALVLEGVDDRYSLWPDESGIVTISVQKDRQVWIAINFVEKLKELVPPID